MQSGGSTGVPKVIVDHRPAMFDPDRPVLGIPKDGVVLNPGPLYHNAPFSVSFNGLIRGCAIVGMRRFDAQEALRLIERHRVQVANFVPTMMHRMWRLLEELRSAFDLSSIERVWHMGAPRPPWLKHAWIDWLGADRYLKALRRHREYRVDRDLRFGVVEETGIGRLARSRREDPCAGRDRSATCCRRGGRVVLHARRRIAIRLLLYRRGAPRGRPGWDSIGDFGWVDEDGYVFFADRRTDLIISGGANIYPAEVEPAISEHPAV